jgi:hypothetical protein
MNFGQALETLKEGKKIKRSHWSGYIKFGTLELKQTHSSIHGNTFQLEMKINLYDSRYVNIDHDEVKPVANTFNLVLDDLIAEDWMVVK